MLEYSSRESASAPGKICLCGIGSAGTKVMEEVLPMVPPSASVCAMNLDARLLNASSIPCKVHLGARVTKGLGSGGDAAIGAQAACESESSILRAVEGSALTVLAVGLGGGTGSGVAPEVARLAKEQGSYVVSVVIRPFRFEGERRTTQADEALARLALYSDMVLRFDNDAMESLIDSDKGVLEAFSVVNALIARAVLIVPSLLNSSGALLSVGLDDLIRVAGTGKGICSFGVGEASSDGALSDMLEQVRRSPLFLEKRLGSVDDVLVLVHGGKSLTLHCLEELVSGVAAILGAGVRLHIGASASDASEDRLTLTVLGVVPTEEEEVMIPAPPIQKPEQRTVPVVAEKASGTDAGLSADLFECSDVAPEKEAFVPSLSPKGDDELEEELMPVRPVVEDVSPTDVDLGEEAEADSDEQDGSSELEEVETELPPVSDIKELEEGVPPEESEADRAGHGMFARSRPLILDGEDLDLPPAMRKKKQDPS